MGGRSGVLASLLLSLAHYDVCILCLPCFPIAGISDDILGTNIDLGSPPRGK